MSNRVSNSAVFALALVLIIGGAWGIWRGSDYIQLERGWASVISGSVAATGGVLALAIGFVLRRLDILHKALLGAGVGSSEVALPLEVPVAAPPVAPMPLGLSPTPASDEPQPQPVAFADPVQQAVTAINIELLEREEPIAATDTHPHASPAPEPARTEAPPEVVHAAHQGPADDMVKAAHVSDEPELDAAIEELLAEERGRGSHEAGEQALAAPAMEISPQTQAPPVAMKPEAPEKARQRSGWRGLFSRKERRSAAPADERTAAEPVPEEQVDSRIASERMDEPEQVAVEEAAPAERDTIPRTGDDWFDRALSGLDEVDRPYHSNEVPEHTRQATEHLSDTESKLEVHPPSLQEPPAAPAPAEPAVIGRYTSGNTTYIMFADGSIEAETPTGILRFASLAELKSYVEGGQ